MNDTEHERGDAMCARLDEGDTRILQMVTSAAGGRDMVKSFQFDLAAGGDISQEDFFQSCGVTALLDSSMRGYAATVFAYGQTGLLFFCL
jgi:hypothetical protein